MNGDINIINKEEEDIIKDLEEKKYPKFKNDNIDDIDNYNYDYLITMTIKKILNKKKNR